MNDFLLFMDYFIEKYKNFKIKYSYCLGLTPVECMFLSSVDNSGLSMKEISLKLKLSPSRTTRIADSLFNKGLIERVIADDDRRKFIVKLTTKGKDIFIKEKVIKQKFEEFLKKNFSEEEIKNYLDFTNKLIELFEEVNLENN